MKQINLFFLAAALLLAAGCSKALPEKLLPTMSAQQAQAVAQPILDRFLHRGVLVSETLLPARTRLYYHANGATDAVAVGTTNVETWVFAVRPDARVNGTEDWMYLFVNALSGDLSGRILSGELQGISWKELYKKEERFDNYTLWQAETTGDVLGSAWSGAIADWKPQNVGLDHVWVRRMDSDADLLAAYSGEYDKPIDWSTKTLLLVAGMEMHQKMPYDLTFSAKGGAGSYCIRVCRVNSFAPATLWWARAILVDKLPAEAEISVEASLL